MVKGVDPFNESNQSDRWVYNIGGNELMPKSERFAVPEFSKCQAASDKDVELPCLLQPDSGLPTLCPLYVMGEYGVVFRCVHVLLCIYIQVYTQIYLLGGFNPSGKYESQLGWLFPIRVYGKIKHVPVTTNQI